MLNIHELRNEYTHNRESIIANFTDFSNADNDLEPICLKNKIWELIKLDFIEEMDKFK
ncbi:MAG: hypothetical protein GXZ03_00010 [Proteiniphilum sp.]|nr:hypothetical protein [Proteiniphilum sp.]